MKLRRGVPLAAATGLVLAIAGATAGAYPVAKPHLCSGTFQKPGVLKGSYPNGVVAKGLCEVNSGKAHVIGTLTVTKGAALAAAFGEHHSGLKVTGNLIVDRGAIVVLGCKVNPTGTGFACLDEPNPQHPTLTSHGTVTGSILERSALAVIVHNSAIGKNVTQTGGGGGVSCRVPKRGIFAAFKEPPFSDYEDSSVGGNLKVSGLRTCWLGAARDKVHGNTTISSNDTKDPDGIEVLANHIAKNLSCHRNSHPSGEPPHTLPIWDSADMPPTFAEYPRLSEPNTVRGKRSGQCVLASPIKPGGPPAAKHF